MSSLEIREKQLKAPIDVAEYLFRRLRQVGIQSVHGVPGDYNLVALDYIPKCDLRWVGNCNELNAAYAADGYARVNGLGALVTAFGVGELSAINGVAGSFSEYVPVIHIVGQPNTISQKGGMLLHHTLGNGDFEVFSKFSSSISCYVAKLLDPNEIPTQIDAAIRECYIRSRPVYITLPTDQVQKKVEGARLETPIDLSLPKNDEEAEDYVVDVVLKYLEAAKSPVILVDACAIRHHCLDEVHALVSKSGLPTFVAPMGKGAVDETLPNYGGVYAGSGSPGNAREHLEASDLILSIGAIKSDFNTSGFTYRTSRMNTIDFHSTQTSIRWSEYPGVGMKGVLRKVVERMDVQEAWHSKLENKFPVSQLKDKDSPDITHSWFWPAIGSWLKEDDIVVTETGTANFGIWEARFPRGVMNISQVLWGSIGYSVGAAQGAALAAKELGNRRVILFVGDGSFQLTAQEVSTMIRNNLTPIIFVICNNGYTIERYIHGWEASYNDVQPWKYKQLVPIFGGRPGYYDTHSVSTQQEILELFANEKFSSAKTLQFVELNMPQEDVPAGLKLTAEAAARLNRRTV